MGNPPIIAFEKTTVDSSPPVQPQRLRRLLRRLVDIYSPSGKEEEILHFVSGYLRRRGLKSILQPVDENRFNLVLMPPDGEPRLAFVGHLDTVVAYDLDEYGYGEDGDSVTGLGTADMKAGCAAMVEAYLAVQNAGSSAPPVALCLVVGEEEDGDGAERLIEEYTFPWAVIGEPTDMRPCLSNYGYLEIQLSTAGRRIHASLANRGGNPVEVMMHTITRISQYMESTRPTLVYNIRDVFSSRAGFAVPDRCEAWVDIHLPPVAPVGEIAAELEEIIESEKRRYPSVEKSLRLATIDAGYELPEKGPFVETLKEVFSGSGLSWAPVPFVSQSDANRLWRAGVKPVLIGPGSLESAHTRDESVSFGQTLIAAQFYYNLAMRM
ncbi:MAG: M20/M25/M40 family metallo-hydrolase [Desulfobacterales bacterium]|nr:M20/M25/M40 family metallo-hydrolase [Desulfobacterales bacterium]